MDFRTYRLWRDSSSFVSWQGPDGDTHSIDVSNPAELGEYAITRDSSGKPVMAYRVGEPGSNFPDGEIIVAIDGAPSSAATLLHYDDDIPRKYYYATDSNSSNPLGRKAFRIRTEGLRESPIARYASLLVMSVPLA